VLSSFIAGATVPGEGAVSRIRQFGHGQVCGECVLYMCGSVWRMLSVYEMYGIPRGCACECVCTCVCVWCVCTVCVCLCMWCV